GATWLASTRTPARCGWPSGCMSRCWRSRSGSWVPRTPACWERGTASHGPAREVDEDTLARRRRVLGPGHPDTLTSQHNLSQDLSRLGLHQAARDLDADTLARRRRVHGDDHPWTLITASNLAVDLRRLGDAEAARDLDADTLARRRRVLGDDHPQTLAPARH